MKISRQIKPMRYLKAHVAETMALLKILALGDRQIDAGRVQSAAEVVKRLREGRKTR